MKRTRHWCLVIAGILGLVGPPATLVAQVSERSWRETLQVPTPLLAAKRWENARGLIEQQAWEAAIAALSALETEFPEALVKVSAGRYLRLPVAVRLMQLNLPEDGLAAYRQQIDGWAGQQYQSAARLEDDGALQQIITTALASSDGDDALNRLAERAWERGDVPTARRLWTLMIPSDLETLEPLALRYPDTDFDLAGIHARLILCSLAEGNRNRAARELDIFAELFPDAEGIIAGQRSRLAEILAAQIDQAALWPSPRQTRTWPTFARVSTRNSDLQHSADVESAVWTLPLDRAYVPRWERPRPALPERGLLSRHPVSWDAGVFLHDGTTIRGLRLSDGTPLWPTNSSSKSGADGTIYPTLPTIHIPLPGTPVVGVPRFTMTAHDGRLFALLGPAVLTLPPGEHNASHARLVCLNLAEEGLLEWLRAPGELFDEGWLPVGTPVASAGRIYVPLLRSMPQFEVGVACLRASDGSLVWQQTIGQALRDTLDGRVELGHHLLTFAEGRVFHSTGLGGIAALNAQTGQLDWVVTYPARETDLVARSDESAVGLLPPLCYEGTLFVKPNDADEILAIDARSGHVHWRQPTPARIVHLLGVSDSNLVASGDQLWAIDVETGRTRWRFGYDDASAYGFGRGAIVGDRIYWPTRENLLIIDEPTGQLRRRIPLEESLGLTGGNICVGGNRLLIAGPYHLTAFELQD